MKKNELEDLRVVFYCLIVLLYGAGGFFYTAFFSGWGHSDLGALPVAFGLAVVMLFVASIVVSQMSLKRSVIVLGGFVLLGALFCGCLYGSR